MARLGFLPFIKNCSLNPPFICLVKHFPAPFPISSLSIRLCYVCTYPKPHPQFSALFPLPIWPPQVNTLQSIPSIFPGSVLVSTAFQSGISCPSTVCRAGVQDRLSAWSRAGPAAAVRRWVLCLAAAQQAQLGFQSDVYRLAVSSSLQIKVLNSSEILRHIPSEVIQRVTRLCVGGFPWEEL